MASPATPSQVTVRQLREDDLTAADRMFRLAFGTFLGAPDPLRFFGDADYIRHRWRAQPQAAFGAECGGELVGSNFATRWGSVGFFGPLTVTPALWDHGIGKRLMEPVMDCFTQWRAAHTGLFTFAHSPKHLHLYRKYGFWPRFLTAILSKHATERQSRPEAVWYSALREEQRIETLAACRELTDSIFAGLDVSTEIASVATQGLGETILLDGNARLDGLAVCHCGPGTEAGKGTCYIKFGAVRPGKKASSRLERLLDACEALAFHRGLERVVAGMNLARTGAYETLADRGFRTDFQGVAMQRPNEAGYNRADTYIIDDWR